MVGWSIPQELDGTAAVIAGGPSAIDDVKWVQHLPCIAVNTSFKLVYQPWMIYGADADWWKFYADELKYIECHKVSIEETPYTKQIGNAGRTGYTDSLSAIYSYANSGAQAIQIAAKAGAKRILLIGFDMHRKDADHWHGAHPAPLRTTTNDTFEAWVQMMEKHLAPALEQRDIEVLNCAYGSALTCWPIVDVRCAL